MPEVGNAAEVSNFFAVAISVLFAVWFEAIEATIEMKRPPAYAERANYISKLQTVALSRAIPLFSFLIAYVFTFSGIAYNLIRSRRFAPGPWGDVDPGASVFCIMYWLLTYLVVITAKQNYRLGRKLWLAREGKPKSQPRIRQI